MPVSCAPGCLRGAGRVLEPMILTRSLATHRLRRGDVGTVVHRTGVGATLAGLTLAPPSSARWAAMTSSACAISPARSTE